MKRKMILLLLTALCLTGCGRKEDGKVLAHFSALREDTAIVLDAPAAPVLEVMGVPFGYAENKCASGQGVQRTYHFPDLDLVTYPGEDGERIYRVQITAPGPETADGITIGTPASDLKAKYGDTAIQNNRCILRREKETMIMQLKNNVVTEIRYSMA